MMDTIQTTFTQNDTSLMETARRHMDERSLSIKELATRCGLDRSMLSQYMNGGYRKPESVECKLRPYLEAQGATELIGNMGADTANTFVRYQPGARFFQSNDAKGIAAMCSLSHQYALLNVVVGKSGYGKTHTLKQYSGLPKVAYIECDDTMERRDLVDALEHGLGMNQSFGSISKRTDAIVHHLNSTPGWLIIVDEADKLISRSTYKKMEMLRKLVDKAKVGVVISGEPQLEPLLKAYDERMANRGSYIYRMTGLAKSEVADYLSVFPMEKAAREVLVERATGSRSGCFRLLDRTLTNVLRLLQERDEDTITPELVEQASDMMML